MRPRVTLVLAIATVVLGGLLLVPAAYARLNGDGGATPSAPAPPTLAAAPVTVKGVDGFLSWALLDRESGKISGARNMTATNSTESMIKVWIVSDYLRQLGTKKPSAAMLTNASKSIRDSNDDATNRLYSAAGSTSTLDRLIKVCGLTETAKVIPPGEKGVWWSYTKMSPRDAVRMGECIKSGKAAGPKWTKWVLTEMSRVQGSVKNQQARQGGGRWGIIDGLPEGVTAQGPVSIKNGWTLINADGKWHLNCLAITDDWVLSVMMRYGGSKGLQFGADACASVASQLVTPTPGAVLGVPRPLTARAA